MKAEYLPEGTPDCPLVRLFEFTSCEAAQLQIACQGLAEGRLRSFPLTTQPWCKPVGEFCLSLAVSEEDLRFHQVAVDFEWAVTGSTWSEVAVHIEPFVVGLTSKY